MDATLVSCSTNTFCEYIIRCNKKNNGIITNLSNAQLGGFKRSYSTTYSSIVAQNGEINNINKLWHSLHNLFTNSNYRQLNSSSFHILKLLIDKSLAFTATIKDEQIQDLVTIQNTMVNTYNRTDVSGIGASSASFAYSNFPQTVPEPQLQATSESEVQLAAIDSIITATLTNSTQENSDGSNSSRASSPSPTNNNDLLVLLQSFIKTMDKKYTDVSDQLKNMGKLVFPKDVLDSHFKELSTRTETFIRLEHHHLMLNNHLENDSAPTSLGLKSFPKPNFQDFGFSQDYIDKGP